MGKPLPVFCLNPLLRRAVRDKVAADLVDLQHILTCSA